MKRYFVVFLVATMAISLAACSKTDDTKTTGDEPNASEVKNTSSGQNLAELWWAAYQNGSTTNDQIIEISAEDSPFRPVQTFANYIEGDTFNFKQFMLDQDFYQINDYQVDAFRYDADGYYIICRLNGSKYGYCIIDYYFDEGEKTVSLSICCSYIPRDFPNADYYKTTSHQNLISDYAIDAICNILINAKTSTDPIRDILIPTTFYFYESDALSRYADDSITSVPIYFMSPPAESSDGSYSLTVPAWYLQK